MPSDVTVTSGIHEDRFGGRWGAAECQVRDLSRHLLHPCTQQAPVGAGKYQYDGGSRVLKAATRAAGTTLYTVYPFSTLELRNTPLTGSGATEDYALNTDTTQLRLSGGAVSGRVLYSATMPRTGASNVHLFLEFGDHLGSTTFIVDHSTSEVVEYVSYMAYGQTENDYRTSRWSNFSMVELPRAVSLYRQGRRRRG